MIKRWAFIWAIKWAVRFVMLAYWIQPIFLGKGTGPITVGYGWPPDDTPPRYKVSNGEWIDIRTRR
jgi:hypothetical protein